MSLFSLHLQMVSSMRAVERALIWNDILSFSDIINLGKHPDYLAGSYSQALQLYKVYGILSQVLLPFTYELQCTVGELG